MLTTSHATIHSLDRAKERIGCNEKAADKQFRLAIERGKTYEDFTSWEQKYLAKEAYDGCVAVAYNGYCYIVNELGFCVTVYQLPAWFGKKKHFNGKERIRNMKSYARNNSDMFELEGYAGDGEYVMA